MIAFILPPSECGQNLLVMTTRIPEGAEEAGELKFAPITYNHIQE
ncbi:MAG TPA: hypothetical protein V6D09_03085 [Leptolyngbyaceae cyanobacterium]